MNGRTLLLLAPLLMGAAAPPPDCGPDETSSDRMPVPLDLSGRALPRSGLASPVFSTLPNLDSGVVCANRIPASPRVDSLQDPRGELLHGLSSPDLVRPGPGLTGR